MRVVLAMAALLGLVAFAGWAKADDESASLVERVKALEARLAAMEQGSEGSDLRLRSLTIVDTEGKPRVLISAKPRQCGLTVQDELGRERIALGTSSRHAGLRLRDSETGSTRLSVALADDIGPNIGLHSPNSALTIEAHQGRRVGVQMWGGPGKLNDRSNAGFWIYDNGTISLGGGKSRSGHTGFRLQQSRRGEFDFYVRNQREELIWEMPQAAAPAPNVVRQIKTALESRSVAEQEKGIEALYGALAGDDPRLVRDALWLLLGEASDIDYDRETMEGLVRKHLDSPNERLRVTALSALGHVLGPKGGDLDSALRVADTDDLAALGSVAWPLLRHAGGRVEDGPAEAAFLRLLRHESIDVALPTARALQGARASQAVQRAFVALWRQHRERYYQLVWGLAQTKPRTRPVVDALLEELSLSDVHGLHDKVRRALAKPETKAAEVASVVGALRLLPVIKSEESQMLLVQLLRQFGSSSDADELERILGSTPFPDAIERLGAMALSEMRKR